MPTFQIGGRRSLGRAAADYNVDGNTISVNPGGPGHDSLVQDVDDPSVWYWEMDDLSGDTRRFAKGTPSDGWLNDGERVIAGKVSRYATSDPLEFVAETHTALMSGERLPDDVMDLYRNLGGKVPSQSEDDAWATATAAGLDVNYSDDDFDFDFGGPASSGDDIARQLGMSQREYEDILDHGIAQGLITLEDLFIDEANNVEFMRIVVDELRRQDP